MSTRPSKSSVNSRLGVALREARPLSDELNDMWAMVESEALAAIGRVQRLFDEIAYHPKPTGRPKTLEVVAGKLRRSPTMQLLNMDDLAGVRALVDDRFQQDALAAHLLSVLSITDPRCLVDRRANPRSGYRAVHVLDRSGFVRCEIQIRTHLQHRWAMAFENLAEVGGRGLRYGEEAARPGSAVAQLAVALKTLSEGIDLYERSERSILTLEAHHLPELGPLAPAQFLQGEASSEYFRVVSTSRLAREHLESALGSIEASVGALTRLKEDGADVLRLGL